MKLSRALPFALRATPALCLATSALAGLSVPAQADVFGPISLLSQRVISPPGPPGQPAREEAQQADYAHDPAVSGDGRYVAFDGSLGGVSGIWRRDLQSGAVERVDACPTEQSACVAELPSISENGQFVSFTTTARLAAGDENNGPDVYVRDMAKPLSKQQPASGAGTNTQPSEAEIDESAAFTLASAVNGSEQGLAYEFPEASGPFEEEHFGSVASGRSALSADGSRVAFVTTAISNLAGAHTPALEVAVRDLANDSTELVSVAYDPATGAPALKPSTGAPEPVSAEEGGLTYGAVYSPSLPPPPFVAPSAYAPPSPIGASLSADGSTVAWMGQNVSLQAQVLSAQTLRASYAEPLWRRIADGSNAATQRVTGGSDPASSACAASGEGALPEVLSLSDPCQGPFRTTEALGVWTGGTGDPVPRLSANGMSVAFLATAPPTHGDFGQDVENLNSDLYVANMAEGLSRTQALEPLTELASGNAQEPATSAPIVDLDISADGQQVAFTTQRTVFPLGSPAYISAPAATPGMVELFDADLANDTLTRVTRGFDGGPSEASHATEFSGEDPYGNTDGALSPSFSDDGNTLVFSSTAANLVYGDGNTPPANSSSAIFDGSDVFAVDRTVFATTPPTQEVAAPPAAPPLIPAWLLGVSALSQKNGNVLLEIEAPGAGRLRAGAQSFVRVQVGRSARTSRDSHSHRTRATVVSRTVASTATSPHGGGLTTITLRLSKRYAALADARGGLSASVTVTLLATGHAPVRQSIAVTFIRAKRPAPRGKSKGHNASTGPSTQREPRER